MEARHSKRGEDGCDAVPQIPVGKLIDKIRIRGHSCIAATQKAFGCSRVIAPALVLTFRPKRRTGASLQKKGPANMRGLHKQ